MVRLVLASASPRRADLLRAAGFAFDVRPVDLNEAPVPGESAEAHVARLAREKARACPRRHPDEVVLGADTVVVVDGAILGKPVDDADARAMLARLSDRVHRVLTGVALVYDGGEDVAVESSEVRFLPLTPREVEWYVASGEPRDKAGAYAVQGLASRFVDGVRGSYSNVVGLPVARVYRMVCRLDEGHASAESVTR